MKKRLLISFAVLLILDLIISIVFFIQVSGAVKISGFLMVIGSSIFVYWFINLAAFVFKKVGTYSFFFFSCIIFSVFCVAVIVFGIKKYGFDPFCTVLLPLPITAVSLIIDEWQGVR